MPIEFRPAVRDRVSLLIGIAGASGSGKTFSALELAAGLAGPTGRIAGIDTEAGRMKHYADRFRFDHGDMRPPFSPEAYIDAVVAADAAGYDVIVIDSFSHEYEGEGGLQDLHDALVTAAVERDRLACADKGWKFDPDRAADKASVGAWKEPKAKHKRMVNRMLQCRAHLIFCLRAEEKMLMKKVTENGRSKTVIIPAEDRPINERWAPICEKRFPYELTLSLLVTPTAPGVPIFLKLQEQHRPAFVDGQQIGRVTGQRLATWATGGSTIQPADVGLTDKAERAVEAGTDAYIAFWKRIGKDGQRALLPDHEDRKRRAAMASMPANDDDSFPGDLPARSEG